MASASQFPSTINQFFSCDEVDQILSDLPRLGALSPHMLVPFQVRRIRRAYVIWLNRRWFLEHGVDVTAPQVEQRVSNWLVCEFAYAVPGRDDPEHAFTTDARTFWADRYGSTTGTSVHGGSGRVATVEGFQAKGVGVTPLAGLGANWVHSHGCASLEESLREAVYSELAIAEFPYGALPVIAVLDTGLHFRAPSSGPQRGQISRRGIIVRPAAIRLAHAERAPLFNLALTGYTNSQQDDVQRTRDIVRWWSESARLQTPVKRNAFPSLFELVTRIAEQVAFGQVHRLFNGGYFSSNLSTSGALLDFGGMRSLPNWANARTLDGVVGYGEEMRIVAKVIQSLAFHFNKYKPCAVDAVDQQALITRANAAHRKAFATECLRIYNLADCDDPSIRAAVVDLTRRYYTAQQRLRVNYKHGLVKRQEWLFDAVAGDCERENLSAERRTLDGVRQALHCYFSRSKSSEGQHLLAWSSAVRYLMPRDLIDREQLQKRLERVLSNIDTRPVETQQKVRAFVHSTVGKSRRHWLRLPRQLAVDAHVASEGSSALSCRSPADGTPVLWLEGLVCRGRYHFFEQVFTPLESDHSVAQCCDGYWTMQLRAQFDPSELSGHAITVCGHPLQIPSMEIRYPRPHVWLLPA